MRFAADEFGPPKPPSEEDSVLRMIQPSGLGPGGKNLKKYRRHCCSASYYFESDSFADALCLLACNLFSRGVTLASLGPRRVFYFLYFLYFFLLLFFVILSFWGGEGEGSTSLSP